MKLEGLLQSTQALNSGIMVEDFRKKVFEIRKKELWMGDQKFSDRALRNLGRAIKVSPRVITTSENNTLNHLIQEQMIVNKVNKFRLAPDPEHPMQFAFVQPEGIPYIHAEKLLEEFNDRIINYMGNPISTDSMRFWLKMDDFDFRGEHYQTAVDLRIDQVSNRSTESEFVLYRQICTNGQMARELGFEKNVISIKEGSDEVVLDLARASLKNMASYRGGIESALDSMADRVLAHSLDDIVDSMEGHFSKSLLDNVRKSASEISQNKASDEHQLNHCDKLENLLDYVNLLTFEAHRDGISDSVRQKTEQSAFGWAYTVLNPSLN